MSQQNSTNQPQQEVDLLVLANMFFKWLKSVCCSVWNAFVSSLIYLIRKSPWLALFVIVGAGIALIFCKATPKFYASSAIVSSNSTATTLVIDKLKTLNFLFSSKQYGQLASILSLSESEAAQVKSLKGYYGVIHKGNTQPAYYVENFNSRDTTLRISPNYFKVIAQVYNEDIYPALSKAIVNYAGNSSFGQQANALREELVKEKIANTDREIAALQQAMASHSATNKSIAFPVVNETKKSELVQMQEALTLLYERKSELTRQSTLFTDPTTVVADFSKTYVPANRNRFYVATSAALAFALGLIGLLLWDNRKKIANAISEKK